MGGVVGGADNGWQERALHRTRPRARKRAVVRGSQFLETATELLDETGRIDFTVQALVERSGLSMRSFYQHFGSKEELLLALYEELLARFTDRLRADVMEASDPLERLERYCMHFLKGAERVRATGGRALSIYHLNLAVDRPADFVKAFEPQLALVREIVDEGVAAGTFRTDVDAAQLTVLINSTLMSVAQTGMFGIGLPGTDVNPEGVWRWCRSAILPARQ